MRRLVVVGQGYVGLPLALRAAEKGFSVVGLDNNPSLVAALNGGRSHIDDISEDELRSGPPSGLRGVGTQTTTTSASARQEGSVDAV